MKLLCPLLKFLKVKDFFCNLQHYSIFGSCSKSVFSPTHNSKVAVNEKITNFMWRCMKKVPHPAGKGKCFKVTEMTQYMLYIT